MKIQRKLEVFNNNARTSRDIKYVIGDKVFYKRASDKGWKSYCYVLGRDGQQVLIKHGIDYVRVHPCRLSLERTIDTEINIETKEQNFNQEQQKPGTYKYGKHKNKVEHEQNSIISDGSDFQMEKFNIINRQCPGSNSDITKTKSIRNWRFKQYNSIHLNIIRTRSTWIPWNPWNPSLEKLSVYDNHENRHANQSTIVKPSLRKGIKIQFKLKDSDEITSATILSRSGKAKGKTKCMEWIAN